MDIRDIQWHSERRAVTIKDAIIALTATEYRLLYPLRYGTPVTYENLALLTYNYDIDEKVRAMIDKHIDRIRKKLRGTGIYIYCVLGYGYVMLPENA